VCDVDRVNIRVYVHTDMVRSRSRLARLCALLALHMGAAPRLLALSRMFLACVRLQCCELCLCTSFSSLQERPGPQQCKQPWPVQSRHSSTVALQISPSSTDHQVVGVHCHVLCSNTALNWLSSPAGASLELQPRAEQSSYVDCCGLLWC